MSNVIHSNPLWEYEDGRGVLTRGHLERFSDRGGTDVSYFFRSCEDAALSVVSGSRLKAARRIWAPCPMATAKPYRETPTRLQGARDD